jgi:hypothetical protein
MRKTSLQMHPISSLSLSLPLKFLAYMKESLLLKRRVKYMLIKFQSTHVMLLKTKLRSKLLKGKMLLGKLLIFLSDNTMFNLKIYA